MKNCFGPHWCAFIVWTYIFKYPKYTFKYINIWNSYMRIIFSYYSDAISHSLIPYTMLHFLKVHCLFFADKFSKFPSSLSGSEFTLSGKAVGVILKAFFKIHPLFSHSFFCLLPFSQALHLPQHCRSNPLLCHGSWSIAAQQHGTTACFNFSWGNPGPPLQSPASPDVPWSREVD